ncbi:hypothetical protein R75465_08199 [Paraburkholderia aspalathi]|nr:hypothetical protein R75465_08199 [Paraburkholderia aspalathi]
MFVQGTLLETIGATGDDGLNASRFQMLQDRVRIVGFVGSQTGGFQFAQQRQSFGTVSCLPARQVKASEHTQAIDQRVNLGTQSATRAPDRLVAFFLAAPAACWWARTIVLSMKISSRSASPASSANTACHISARDHLAKRRYTLFHGPKSGGKSRHGLPVRAIHSTASTNNRLSAAVRPGSVDLPGSKGPIRSYWSSLSINLGILCFRKRQDVNRFPHKLTAPSAMIVNRP